MNEFEKKMNELRLQFKAEQRQIAKDSYRKINRLNTAIGLTNILEAREALRSERRREYEAMRCSHELNRTCYLQQIELLNDQYCSHLKKNPSKRQLRRMIIQLCKDTEAKGEKSLTLAFGDNRHCLIKFD